jgi:CHAD domain-containing protein
MPIPLLSQEDRETLQTFMDQCAPGAPYSRRARILLMADAGASQETIAAEVAVAILRVRHLLRAYKREGLSFIPETVFSPAQLFTADDPLPEAARKIMGDLLDRIRSHAGQLAVATDVTSVHETRKNIRRMRTALELFAPLFEDGYLQGYLRRFRKAMRRLGRPRDIAVFLLKLDRHIEEVSEQGVLGAGEGKALEALSQFWRIRQERADAKARRYLTKGKYQKLLSEFGVFTKSAGQGVAPVEDPSEPSTVRQLASAMIYKKVATVRAFDGRLKDAPPILFHALRIECKELRYTLEFFEPVLGPSVTDVIETLKRALIHLGDLNDARIHLEMLDIVVEGEPVPGATLYRQVKKAELERLMTDFSSLWSLLAGREWRADLSTCVAVL